MKIRILFPRDSKKLTKGFKEEVYEVPAEVLREVLETYRQTRNINRAIDVVCSYVAMRAAEKWCTAMGRKGDMVCINNYLDKQGERIREQCETSFRQWLAIMTECTEKCGKDRECLSECIGT